MSGAMRRMVLISTAMLIVLAAPTFAADWPQFHGPTRDNLSPDKGLLKQWPKGGPRLIWKFADCGGGYAGMSIVGDRIYTCGDFADKEFVLALTLDGKLAWKTQNGRCWRNPHPGGRTTPTLHEGTLYHMNPHGRLAALDAKMGKVKWAVELAKVYVARPGTWAMAENVIIEGDTVLCSPGGEKGRVVALDKATGKEVWVCKGTREGPAYCSPIVFTHAGVRQMVTILAKSLISVDVRTGKLLWTHPHETKHDQNVTMPIYRDGLLFASSGHGTGGRLLKIAADSKSVQELWLNKDLDNCHGGVLMLGETLFGSGCKLFKKGLIGVDFSSGKTLWTHPAVGKVSMTFADGMVYGVDDKAKVSLLKLSAAGGKIVSQFKLPSQTKKLSLSHPVVLDGRLYFRHWTDLFVFDVKAR